MQHVEPERALRARCGAVRGLRLHRPTRRGALAAAALVLVLPLSAAGTKEDATPAASAVIDRLHAALLDVMKHAVELGYEGRAKKLAGVIPQFFDIDFMAHKSLGRHWNDADPAEQKRFLDTFERFMVANYAGRFDGWSGQSFETLGQEPARLDTVIVRSRLIDPEGEDVDLNYRMRQVDGQWRIIDVYLDGTVSELALRRSEFVSIVKRGDFEALLVALDEKIRKLANGEQS